jgi:hypothetical protein
MTLKVAYFQPVIIAMDTVPPVEFSKIYALAEMLHQHPQLNDADNPFLSIRGGQQIQVYPNEINLDVDWLIKWLETVCQGYMNLVMEQSGVEELKLCKPVVTSVWTIQQKAGDYQEMHSHPGGNLSGNIYITAPELNENHQPSDSQLLLKMPMTKDISKFIMNDYCKIPPVAGNMVMFPSYIAHTVYPWTGSGTRTVMAFDARLVPIDE